jgi:hypothetical protein
VPSLSRAFRYILLVSVLLNLGDAPYLDEIFSESTQQQEHSALLADLDDGGADSSKPADKPYGACCGQLLLSLQSVITNSVVWSTASATQVFPPEAFFFIVPTLSDRIDRPPRRDSRSS